MHVCSQVTSPPATIGIEVIKTIGNVSSDIFHLHIESKYEALSLYFASLVTRKQNLEIRAQTIMGDSDYHRISER